MLSPLLGASSRFIGALGHAAIISLLFSFGCFRFSISIFSATIALAFNANATPASTYTDRTITMHFQLRSLAATLRHKSRLPDTDAAAPSPWLKTKPPSAWSQAWRTCRRKAAHINLRRRRRPSSFTSSSPKPTSREATPPSLSSAESIAKPTPQVQGEVRPPLVQVASLPSVSVTSDDGPPLVREVASGQVVYRSPAHAACVQPQEATKDQCVEAETNEPSSMAERTPSRERGKPSAGVLPDSPTVVSITSDYDTPTVDDGSCYESFTADRRLVVETYLELQAETSRSFVHRW